MTEQKALTDLEKYNLVNACETIEELQEAILKCAEGSTIVGRTKPFNANNMQIAARHAILGDINFNSLTRNWGIRQQALYIAYSEGIIN